MELCARTLALWNPGRSLPGVHCSYRYTGNVPLTGSLICTLCGKRKGEMSDSKPALKHDGEKPRTDLLDPLALEGIANVLAFGAKKYAAHNWRQGFAWSRLIGAALRHLFAIMRGEDIDPESGLPHVDHLGCCWMFLSWHMKTGAGTDDRWKKPE